MVVDLNDIDGGKTVVWEEEETLEENSEAGKGESHEDISQKVCIVDYKAATRMGKTPCARKMPCATLAEGSWRELEPTWALLAPFLEAVPGI